MNGYLDVVNLLIQANADLNIEDNSNCSALCWCELIPLILIIYE